MQVISNDSPREMLTLEPSKRGAIGEALSLALAAIVYAFVVAVFAPPINAQIVVVALALCFLVYLSWRNSRQGTHPCFLFMGLLLLFQGGGLLAFILSGGSNAPLDIALALTPFSLPYHEQSLTLLLVLLSALCIYLPVRLSGSQVEYEDPAPGNIVHFVLLILIICLPFHFWKNYEYLVYVRSHGGYLAIFQSDEHINQVGFLVRALSQVCTAAFLIYFVYERVRPRLFLLSFLYFTISVVELMIGLRGKVLLLFICYLYLWKLKRRSGFQLRGLIVLGLALAVVAQFVAVFRENKAQKVNLLEVPALFLSTEGISLNVTEAAVAFYPQFAPYRWNYVRSGLVSVFRSEGTPQALTPQGDVFDDDTSMFLNPEGYQMGFGTGGSYIAEGYLFGRALGVLLESLAISGILVWIARNLRGWRTPYAWTIMLSIVYLPRANLFTVLTTIAHACAGVAAVFLFAAALERIGAFLRFGVDPTAQPSRS